MLVKINKRPLQNHSFKQTRYTNLQFTAQYKEVYKTRNNPTTKKLTECNLIFSTPRSRDLKAIGGPGHGWRWSYTPDTKCPPSLGSTWDTHLTKERGDTAGRCSIWHLQVSVENHCWTSPLETLGELSSCTHAHTHTHARSRSVQCATRLAPKVAADNITLPLSPPFISTRAANTTSLLFF